MKPFRYSQRSTFQKVMGLVTERAVVSAVNGLVYVLEGQGRSQVGNAVKDLVFKKGKLELYRVRPLAGEHVELGHIDMHVEIAPRFKVPVLLVPPLMVKPYIYDLRPEHSMVRWLRNAGFDVFIVDFGIPDQSDEGLTLDNYVLDFLPSCVNAALEASGAPELSLVGYCMGGIFSLLYAAAYQDARVKNIVTVASPVDFEKLGVISMAVRLGDPMLDRILDRLGNVPGSFSSTGFRILSGTKAITKYADLLVNLYDDEYVRGFDAMGAWLNDMIPYPKEAFRQMVRDVVRDNKMIKGELRFGERTVNLRNVTAPILAFAGKTDGIAPPESIEQILALVGSHDKTLRLVSGGHVGSVAGTKAREQVWEPMGQWLKEKGQKPS